jgi:hypothetical protein
MAATQSNLKWTPLGYMQMTSLSVAVGLGPLGTVIPTNAIMCLICAEGQAVRWRDDGVAPTAAVGMPLQAGQEFQYTSNDLTQIQFIQQAASAILNVSFYK